MRFLIKSRCYGVLFFIKLVFKPKLRTLIVRVWIINFFSKMSNFQFFICSGFIIASCLCGGPLQILCFGRPEAAPLYARYILCTVGDYAFLSFVFCEARKGSMKRSFAEFAHPKSWKQQKITKNALMYSLKRSLTAIDGFFWGKGKNQGLFG